MNNENLTITFVVDETATDVFNAVNDITKWWTENTEGSSCKINDEFTVQFEDVHFSKQKLTEVVPNEKVVWLVTDSFLSWLNDKQEWTGTTIIFEVTKQANQTQLRFTHVGLNPTIECFNDCSNAWNQYIGSSLFKLITTGKGQPEKKTRATPTAGR